MATVLQDDFGNSLTCRSPEALRLYCDAVELFVNTKQSFATLLKRAIELDGDFILARCLVGCLLCDIYSQPDTDAVRSHLQAVNDLYSVALDREKRHIEAFRAASCGRMRESSEILDKITVYYPRDFHAVKLVFGVYKSVGDFHRMRNVLSRSVEHCSKQSSLYPHILSLYAFSLEETNERQNAEELCWESLSLQPINPWATHTLAHVIEETKEAKEGVVFLSSSRNNWRDTLYNHHLTWHLCLYYLDLDQPDKALEEFDSVMAPSLNTGSLLSLVDVTSLLWRLNIMGIDPGEKRWKAITDTYQSRIGQPTHSWLEAHLMMSLCYGKVSTCSARLALARQVITSMEDFSKSDVSSDCTIADMLGVPVCNALLAYGEERYDEVLSLMIPLRYDLIRLGGSWAQRQVFEMTLIMAAVNGNQLNDALAMIIELKAKKPNSRVLQRLYDKVNKSLKA